VVTVSCGGASERYRFIQKLSPTWVSNSYERILVLHEEDVIIGKKDYPLAG